MHKRWIAPMLSSPSWATTDVGARVGLAALSTVCAWMCATAFQSVLGQCMFKRTSAGVVFHLEAYLRYLHVVQESWTRVLFFGARSAEGGSLESIGLDIKSRATV